MNEKHDHRPGFLAFLFQIGTWKGMGYRRFRCKACGAYIWMLVEQQKAYNCLGAIPFALAIPFLIIQRGEKWSLVRILGFCALYLLLNLLAFAAAFHFARFETEEEKMERTKNNAPARKRQ